MIEINEHAKKSVFRIIESNIGFINHYGSPPIFYWFRNVVEAVKLIDNGRDIPQGSHSVSLDNSLGVVYFDVVHTIDDAVYVITDFVFNHATIEKYLKRPIIGMYSGTTLSGSIFTNLSKQIVDSEIIGRSDKGKIECCHFKDGSIMLQYQGKNIPLKSQFDKMIKRFYRYRDGYYGVFEKGNVKYKLYVNDTTEMISEVKYNQIIIESFNNKSRRQHLIRITEQDIRDLVLETLNILFENDRRIRE